MAMERLRHEEAIIRRLNHLEHVSRLATATSPANALVLEDGGDISLAHLIVGQRLEIPRLLKLARQLADIVATVHGAGVTHRDINPGNILLSAEDAAPILIDFDHATTFAEERPPFIHHREIAGNLPYLAPEQTGRVGRPLDQRADLYGLGATLYELATGTPPFSAPDPLELIHQILTQEPTPPVEREPRLPRQLSLIIMRLLEKEPDRRYQSAEGLAHDLARLRDGDEQFDLGEQDFPLRFSPPSRLVGREQEIQALRSALERACAGQGACVLVSGAPGIGKTTLINELRPMVTARRGWFVSGKFDQYRRDHASDGVAQALRAMGCLLLAENEDELGRYRMRILDRVGSNAGLITAALPEFATLLGVAPAAISGDPLEAQVRLHQAGLELLRAVASPDHPLVMVVDDLQWANKGSIGFINTLLTSGELNGFLLVCAYRETEVAPLHPLSARLTAWQRLADAPVHLGLRNLPCADLSLMVADMLRLRTAEATELARSLSARTQGNPYDTMELLNALRRDGVLRLGRDGWRWDEAAIRRHVGQGDVIDLVAARITGMPTVTRDLLEVMACLGSETQTGLLAAATGLSATALQEAIRPALEDGLLVLEQGESTGSDGSCLVRFRHDRVQQAAHDGLEPSRRSRLQLTLGRRLARLPEFVSLAAEQYLAALEMITASEERRFVAGLFHGAAGDARVSANHGAAERFLAASLELLTSLGMRGDDPACVALETEWHGALYCLARLDQADTVFHSLEQRCSDPLELVDAACIQINSLSNRNRQREAVALGLELLRRLGFPPPRDLEGEVQQGLRELYDWVADLDAERELMRREIDEPRMLAAARLLQRMVAPAFFYDPLVSAWLTLMSRRLWAEHGPCPALLAGLAGAPVVTTALRDDYETGYRIVRLALRVGEVHGYEPESSWVRHCFALFSAHWAEPLEGSIGQALQARRGLLQGGDLQYACFTFHTSLAALLECGESLTLLVTELEQALAFARRTANGFSLASFLAYQQFVRALLGSTDAPGGFSDHSLDEAAFSAGLGENPVAAVTFHILRGLAAALFGDAVALIRHAAQAMPLVPHIQGFYPVALAHLLQALACAERLRNSATPDERAGLLAELDVCREWLACRAEHAPTNFLHLVKLVEAERAWATGDCWGSTRSFDAAMTEAGRRQRPWHRALVTERAARFHLAQGLEQTGRTLLGQARELYRSWGATGKLRQLEREAPFFSTGEEGREYPQVASSTLSNDGIDLLAMMRASQALSSETSLQRLKERVIDLLGAMTGATRVQLVIRTGDGQGWHLLGPAENGDTRISLEQAADQGLVPLSVVRYVERTLEPLLLHDATQDDRFWLDPYLTGLERCSLLTVPLMSHGEPRALLLLENSRGRNAFSLDRLDAVMLLAGQLAVSLDNALLYDSLELKVAERTSALESEIVARRSAEELYRTLVEHSPDGILMVNPCGGAIVRFNGQAHLQLGYSRDEFSRLSIADLAKTDAEHLEMLTEQGEVRFETSHRTRQGEVRTIQARFKAIDYGGKAMAHCIYRDITDSRKMEQELLKARNLESLGLLAGGIAHDFNNLLTAILGNISLAQMLVPGDGKLYKLLTQAEKTSLRAGILTRQLLTFARGGAPIRQVTALSGLVREWALSSLPGSQASCSFTIPDDLWPCQVDEGQISQVINNLVINADQAMPEGGTISISAENLLLAPGSPLPLDSGPYLKIDVRDEGEGIPPELISSVFDPYFTTRQDRSGLGLATTYSIMKRHGGLITVESEAGVGTLFSLYLPAMAGKEAEKEQP
ncbi:AAA family ATPase [Pelobacter propionicus]|uniref:histidine kinase n=1 Tax=Pelobacter propionicus (strain DSM 2379 / NBRC 103807 / OttBd1) TaxID=338966 RepID=A1AUI2_PELPD|nr:AAA family ATPase [Pelobacter propionicus]ABL01003.1 PAS sensor protein [Pelobacter propionicus DSM 2379]